MKRKPKTPEQVAADRAKANQEAHQAHKDARAPLTVDATGRDSENRAEGEGDDPPGYVEPPLTDAERRELRGGDR